MENEIRINLAWQSEEPVVKIIVSAGKEQVVIDKNIDNDRNDDGYTGEMDIVVPSAPYAFSSGEQFEMNRQSTKQANQSGSEVRASSASSSREMVQYTVQLIDEVNQRSTLLKDLVRRPDPAYSMSSRNRTKQLQPTSKVIVEPKDPLNTAINATIGMVGKMGAGPEVKNATAKFWDNNRISIVVEASDSKGVDSVAIEVRDGNGSIVHNDSISCDSAKQCQKETDSFSLANGSYALTAIAANVEQTKSQKYSITFKVANVSTGKQLPGAQQPPQSAAPAANQSEPNVENVPVVTRPEL